MPIDALTQYLQDHLAGSVAALQLMETLADHERGRPLEQKLRALHAEVTAPRAPTVLQHAMVERERMDAAREALRTAAGAGAE